VTLVKTLPKKRDSEFNYIGSLSLFKGVLKEFSNGNSKREEIIRMMRCKGKTAVFEFSFQCLSNFLALIIIIIIIIIIINNINTPCHIR
jgi:hypothetical protein